MRLLLISTVVLLAACGTRLSDEQAQALSDAKAGAEASRQLTAEYSAEVDPLLRQQKLERLMQQVFPGVAGFTLAASANVSDLPAPRWQPAVLLAVEPEPAQAYADAGAAAAANPPKGFGWAKASAIGLSLLGALGMGLKLARNVPGWGGLVASLLGGLYDSLAPKKVVEAERQVDKGLNVAIAYGARVGHVLTQAGYGHLVEDAKFRAALYAEQLGVREEVDRRLKMVETGKVALPPVAAPVPSLTPPTAMAVVKPPLPSIDPV